MFRCLSTGTGWLEVSVRLACRDCSDAQSNSLRRRCSRSWRLNSTESERVRAAARRMTCSSSDSGTGLFVKVRFDLLWSLAASFSRSVARPMIWPRHSGHCFSLRKPLAQNQFLRNRTHQGRHESQKPYWKIL